MDSWMLAILPLLAGWILDLLLGDPQWLPHPVVWFGKAIAACEHKLNRGHHRNAKGAVVAICLIALVFALTWLVRYWLLSLSSYLLLLFDAVIIFYCLAGTTLIREVHEVFYALDRSLEEGRQQVARIVGRDTSELSAQEVRTAALETLAENLSDGVIAPLFWFALLGTPGMLAYKMVNTLDSMIGYKTERYKDFGCWAAHIDDVANYLPARLTALLMILASGKLNLLAFVWKNGPRHASPNSGYPEAALAGILNCRFGGPHYYFGQLFDKPYIGENERPLTTAEWQRYGCFCWFFSDLFGNLNDMMYFCTQKLKKIKEMRNLTWAIAVVVMLCSCSGKNTKKQGADATSDAALVEVTVKYATGFSVRDSADIRLVDVGKHDHFALVRTDDMEVPDGYTKVRVPIQRTICMTALQLSNFTVLNAHDVVKGLTGTKNLFNKDILERVKDGRIVKIGMEGNFDTEMVLAANPDVIFISPSKRGGYEAIKETGILLVPHLGYQELDPLGQAEWIKFIGMFIGKEKEANERSFRTG